jgi:glycerophosphoryl diester phosphodiesterase
MPRPLIYAHRGSSFDHPENTKAAFMAAITDGADGFECDLRLTKDGQVVIWHDSNMLRMANHKAVVAHTEFSELKEIYPDLMLLSELLEISKKYKKALALETKHPVPTGNDVETKIIELVKDFKGLDIALLSFSWMALEKVVRLETELETVALTNAINGPIMNRFSTAKSFAPGIDEIRNHPELVSKYHNDGKRVFVWTVNEDDDLKLCAELGVDVVITDIPARAVSALGYP